jgi:hypothetical protein
MNKITLVFLFLLVNMLNVGAQYDSLNKLDSKGRKQGYWLCYLNDKFTPTDSSKAVYVGFDLYNNDQNLTKIGRLWGTKDLIFIDSVVHSSITINRFKVLNGKVLAYNKENLLIREDIYDSGHPVKFIAYCDYKKHPEDLGKITEITDFTKLYNNIRGTYYYEFRGCGYDYVKKCWFRKGNRKWKLFRIKE